MKRRSAMTERNPPSTAMNADWPICSRKPMESEPGAIRSQAASILSFKGTNATKMKIRATTAFIIRAAKKSQLQSRCIRKCKWRRVHEVSVTYNWRVNMQQLYGHQV